MATQGSHILLPNLAFLPDYTEHPKPKRKGTSSQKVKEHVRKKDEPKDSEEPQPSEEEEEEEEEEVTFWQDFVAGGMAGTASVIVGHPMDTIKVRVQNSSASTSLLSTIQEFGGVSSLFRGMGAPLSAAAIINAIVFSSYGLGSRLYDTYLVDPATYDDLDQTHDPWQKAMTCGSFAGLVQCLIICPMEHVKCRLQVQHGKGSADYMYKGPFQATRGIVQNYGLQRLYQGWWSTAWREVPAFGLYFAVYDHMKDRVNRYFWNQQQHHSVSAEAAAASYDPTHRHSHTWLASALAGGIAGSTTWGVVYPIDVVKTKIQTAPLDTPLKELKITKIASSIVAQHGWRRLFRGLGITLVRAFPVNGTIFPVYEFTLHQINKHMSS